MTEPVGPTKSSRRLWREAVSLAAATGVLIALGVVLAVSSDPGVRAFGSVDFYDYYYAARAIVTNRSPYDPVWADAMAVAEGCPVIPGSDFIYPAWFAAVLVPLTALPPQFAALVWYALSCLGLFAAVRLLLPPHQRWFIGPLLAFQPVLFSLFVGQVNLLLATALSGAWVLRDRKPLAAGTLLGLAVAIKLSPVLLVLPLVAHRRWKMLGAAAVTGLACLGVGEAVSPGSTTTYIAVILPQVSALLPRHAHPVNQGIGAFFLRLLSDNNWTVPLADVPQLVRPLTLGCSLVLLAFVAYRTCQGPKMPVTDALAWALCTSLAVVLSPLAWESTYVLLAVAAAVAMSAGLRVRWFAAAGALLLLQRVLDDFANHPDAHPVMRAWPLLSAWGLYGGLAAVAALAWAPEWRGQAARPGADVG